MRLLSQLWKVCLLLLSVYWTSILLNMLMDFGSMCHNGVLPLALRLLPLTSPLLTARAVAGIATFRAKWAICWCVILIAEQILFSLFYPPWLFWPPWL